MKKIPLTPTIHAEEKYSKMTVRVLLALFLADLYVVNISGYLFGLLGR